MSKFFASRTARIAATIALTFATIALWGATTHAAEPTFHETAAGSYGKTVNGHKVVFAKNNATGKATQGYWIDTEAALHYAPLGAAKGNPPSAARAQMAKFNVPGGCVLTTEIRKDDGAIIRHSHCEYTPAMVERLATTGK